MKPRFSRHAFILVEIILILLIVTALFPIIHGFVFRQISKENHQIALDNEVHQIGFAQNTLKRLNNEADYVDVASAQLVFHSSRDVTTIYLKNKQLAQETAVLRYLTVLPVDVSAFSIQTETPNRLRLTLQTRNQSYDWTLIR